MSFHRRLVSLAALSAALPLVASAHPGHDGHDLTWDFSDGFAHPISGWDHLITMVAIGVWASQLGGRARWIVPVSFVGMMAIGTALGRLGFHPPGIEQGIVASIVVLGLLVARTVRVPTAASAVVAGLFAMFHGLAHGSGMAAGSNVLGYTSGLLVATVGLHLVGLALGRLLKTSSLDLSSSVGWAVAASGVVLLAS